MSLLPSGAELAAISTLSDAVAFTGLATETWLSVNAALGNAMTTRVLAGLPAEAITAVVASASVPPSTPGGPGRGLTPVEVAQVGLAYRIARARHGLAGVDRLVTGVPAAAQRSATVAMLRPSALILGILKARGDSRSWAA